MTQESVPEGSMELSMIMLVDTLAERYGMLPSQVMKDATTFDVFVADAAIGYRNLIQDRAMNKSTVPSFNPDDFSEEELLKILKEDK